MLGQRNCEPQDGKPPIPLMADGLERDHSAFYQFPPVNPTGPEIQLCKRVYVRVCVHVV